jgi:hypothetical protein
MVVFKGFRKKKLTDIGLWFGFPLGLLDSWFCLRIWLVFLPDIGLIDFTDQSTSDTNIQPQPFTRNWNNTLV